MTIGLDRETIRKARLAARRETAISGLVAAQIEALVSEDEARMSFWDSLILAAAAKSGARKLLTEDLDPGRAIAGITSENPFAAMP